MEAKKQMIDNGTMETFMDCGCKVWRSRGRNLHRLTGQAIDRSACKKGHQSVHPNNMIGDYYIHGCSFTEEEHRKKVEQIKQEALKEIEDMIIRCYAWFAVLLNHSMAPTDNMLGKCYSQWARIKGDGFSDQIGHNIWQVLKDCEEKKENK